MNIVDLQDMPDLVTLLQEAAIYLGKDWPRDVEFSSISEDRKLFYLRGTCPHCGHKASFGSINIPYEQGTFDESGYRLISGAQCAGCNRYILAIIQQNCTSPEHCYWSLVAHYPLGTVNHDVSEDVPEACRLDFQEALRCIEAKAFNATIEMCRRALESSCVQLGADQKLVLEKMIDWVHSQGLITTPLKNMATKIRLGGNRAAHPHSDKSLTEWDADAVIEFTDEFFNHVYVLPAKLAKIDFSKPKP